MSDREALTQDVTQLIEALRQAQDEVERWKQAHTIACENIAQLNDQRASLMEVLTHGLLLLDQLLTEMRLANVTPSSPIIVSKAEFDKAMRKLLAGNKQS